MCKTLTISYITIAMNFIHTMSSLSWFSTSIKWYSFDPEHNNVTSLFHSSSLSLSISWSLFRLLCARNRFGVEILWGFCGRMLGLANSHSWNVEMAHKHKHKQRSKITSVPYFSSIWWLSLCRCWYIFAWI